MRKRHGDIALLEAPQKKRSLLMPDDDGLELIPGEILTDITGKCWKLGKSVGQGGFGQIYQATDNVQKEIDSGCTYAAKVESHQNGPLFVEINCYLRIAKESMIEEWMEKKGLKSLGMPHYVASGSHLHQGEKYRFLILPKYDKDLEKILEAKKKLNLKTVLLISCQIIDVLEYIHSKGYIHSDIKASNILLNNNNHNNNNTKSENLRSTSSPVKFKISHPVRACRMKMKIVQKPRNLRNLRSINYCEDGGIGEEIGQECRQSTEEKPQRAASVNQVHLLDYGLACKYLWSKGNHKPFVVDARKAHAGTIQFCSRDAHKGVASRRSDLESLGYNIIYWLTGSLPWLRNTEDPEIVEKMKQRAFASPELFLELCFGQYPQFLLDYFKYLGKLQFDEKPNYDFLRDLFQQTFTQYGYKNDGCFEFDNLEVWGQKQKRFKKRGENRDIDQIVRKIARPPLLSNNIPIKPLLRKKAANKKLMKIIHWSRIYVDDPETIFRQAYKEKKNTELNDSICNNILNLHINKLNPTYAMLEVYNKCKKKLDSSPSAKGDYGLEYVEGYTPAMMTALKQLKERRELELEEMAVNSVQKRGRKRVSKRGRKTESHITSPSVTRMAKIASTDYIRKGKSIALKRTCSLKG